MARLKEGTRLVVGSHEVTVVQFLLEGGFSQIYEVTMDPKEGDSLIGCLKQVIVPDKNGLNILRKEVDVMKILRKAQSIVRYFDSNAERLENGTYQVLVLMELCPNKSLLDYMNVHIREKLSEKDILKIMKDIALAIYEMHKLKLVHRDIKIENVLIDAHHHFKLCDFGSVSAPIRPPKDQQEFQALSHDILYHTTPQYRAPEMIDLYRGFPIDERSDIWALGCFLYKLCYYITPFEAAGDIAILHASFQFPPAPVYSGDLKNLIIIMLQESPLYRPNIVQILMLLCRMMGIEFSDLDIDDFYHAGEYNFQALHEMQRQKQNELLKQQQYYFEQQKQQQKYESSRREQLIAQSLLQEPSPVHISSHGSVGDFDRRALSKTPQPRQEERRSTPLQASQVSKILPQGPAKEHLADIMQAVTAQIPSNSPPQNTQLPPVGSQSVYDPSKLASRSKVSAVADSDGSVSQLKSPALSPEFMSTKSITSVNSIISMDGSDESEVDLGALTNLEDAENRYPSLDALDGVLTNEAGATKTQEKVILGTVESPTTPKISILRTASVRHNVDENPLSQMYKVSSSSQNQKIPSEFENIEAWKKLSTSINKNAERLAGEIFLSRATSDEPQVESKSECLDKSGVSLDSSDRARNSDLAESTPVYPEDPSISRSRSKELVPIGLPSFGDYSNPQSLGSHHGAGAGPPDSSAYPVIPQQYAKSKRESSNPWGNVIRRNEPPAFDGKIARNPGFGNTSEFDLNQQVLKLNLEEPPKAAPRKAPEHEQNLIELEIGLSSSHSDIAPQFLLRPTSRYEEVSLLDLGIDEEQKKRKESKPVFKMKISDIQNQPISFQEEVIDFASDDENSKSEMSRVAIRNSLKKPKSRKLSDHHPNHKRSESSHAEHRKRLSFFGGAQD